MSIDMNLGSSAGLTLIQFVIAPGEGLGIQLIFTYANGCSLPCPWQGAVTLLVEHTVTLTALAH